VFHFIVSPNQSALSHKKSASTGTLHDICCAQRCYKMDAVCIYNTSKDQFVYIYIYIYIYVCVCGMVDVFCVCVIVHLLQMTKFSQNMLRL
jgi:hypothetical protein